MISFHVILFPRFGFHIHWFPHNVYLVSYERWTIASIYQIVFAALPLLLLSIVKLFDTYVYWKASAANTTLQETWCLWQIFVLSFSLSWFWWLVLIIFVSIECDGWDIAAKESQIGPLKKNSTQQNERKSSNFL